MFYTFTQVCNHERECHCDPGWAPPYCDVKLSELSKSKPFTSSPYQHYFVQSEPIQSFTILTNILIYSEKCCHNWCGHICVHHGPGHCYHWSGDMLQKQKSGIYTEKVGWAHQMRLMISFKVLLKDVMFFIFKQIFEGPPYFLRPVQSSIPTKQCKEQPQVHKTTYRSTRFPGVICNCVLQTSVCSNCTLQTSTSGKLLHLTLKTSC